MGVRRAVEMSLDASNSNQGPICSYGPLIHNPQVLALLEEKGIRVIREIPENGSGTILIRAHGVPPEIKKKLIAAGFTVKDATCPRVIKVQTIIRKHAGKGYSVIIVGDNDHPEVIGLLGYAGEKGYVVNSIAELEALPKFGQAIVVAQTTQNTKLFEEVTKWAEQNCPHYELYNTICDSTEKRQAEVKTLAEKVDTLIVVGGRNSGNTQRLVEVAREAGKPAIHIEDESELDRQDFRGVRTFGITAGASTPNWIINRVLKKIESLQNKNQKKWRKMIEPVQQALFYTNLYVAIGASCLTYTSTSLQGVENNASYIFISFLYVLSMHTLNNLIGRKSDQFNDPARAYFYEKHKFHLALLACLAGGTGLITACVMGMMPFLLLTTMSIMGLLYNIKLIPDRFRLFPYHRISEVPGSKTILIVLAWGIVTSVFPALSENGRITVLSGFVFFWTIGIVFVRTAFFDILAMQGDRIAGTKTLPIIIGEKKTRVLLRRTLMGSVFFLFAAGLWGSVFSLAISLCLIPALMWFLLYSNKNMELFVGVRSVFWMEANFVLAGLITYLWHS
ncbi:MAG: 4-hydroxy-3-methylbut-2-enyl diphosphate reductase [Desulfobacteraceae bacterium]|nr:MAG: 4-hydroxy-3-methylbut-2-enyl diphosphate reductase [Desulfobacteraceae bacterium]